ncbi:MAG: penicillin acylase family protein [Dehalococcoidia bacterium]
MNLAGRARQTLGLARGLGRSAVAAATRRALPQVDGVLRVAGPSAPIDVIRDRHGVPHVFAQTDADALFGQGLVHAQDRLFQMDLLRRVAAGRLAAVAGARALASDRFMVRLGLDEAAARDLALASPERRALLDAYARGVNEGIRTLPALPPEYEVFGGGVQPWRPEDSLLVGRLILFGFAGNWDTELLRERLIRSLGVERAAAIEPVHPRGGTTTTGRPHALAAERMLEAFRAAVAAGLPSGAASNAWAVTGRHTTTQAPLLASDPHLQPRLPGLLHVTHIDGDRLKAAGADFAGVPGIAMGHNEHVAWGITAGMADVSDCFVEEFDPAEPLRYRTPDGWATAEERIERILVRDAEPVEERVRITRHGPVVGPAMAGEAHAIALRSTALEAGDLVGPFLAMAQARDLDEFETAIEGWPGTTFNFVFADVQNRVGYRMVGRVPRRAVGEGLLPVAGAASDGPSEAMAPAEMPRLVDPPSGVVVSANQAPGGEAELGEEWCEPRRAERIVGLLASREKHHVASFQAIQVDRYSAHLVRLRDLLLARGAVAEPEGPILERWDGRLEPESAGAAIAGVAYEALARSLAQRVAGVEASLVLGAGVPGATGASSYIYRMQGQIVQAAERAQEPWFDGVEDRDRQLAGAAARAVEVLRERLGPDPRRWRWGAMLEYRPAHPLAGVPGVGRVFGAGPYPFGGDVNTVQQAAYTLHDARAGAKEAAIMPAYRQVLDLADWDRSTFILPTGNSGIPGHPRYTDCVADYLAGRQRPLLFTPAAVAQAAEARLSLVPAEAAP